MMAGFKEIDSPVQMRLYTLTKHQFILLLVSVIGAFGITLIVGIAGPPSIGHQIKTAKELGVSPKDFKTGPFLLNSGVLTQFNQELWLFCQFQLSGLPKKGFDFRRKFYTTIKILGSSKDASYKLITQSYHNRTRTLKCSSHGCDPIVAFHLGSLDYPSYLVNMTIYKLSLPRGVKIRNVLFTFKYYDDQFTQMEIWFRFAFLVLSFTVTCLFTLSLRKFPVRDWCIEQRWMSALLPLLLLYNNPLFPLNFLVDSWVPRLFDAIFQASFFSALLMFWLCVYHGMRQNERKFLKFYFPKVVIVGLIWATGCSILAWQDLNEIKDPSYQYKVDVGHFLGLKVFFFIVAGIYVFYLLVLLAQAFNELRNLPYFGMRLKFMTVLMVIVVLVSLAAIFMRFGTSVLQENFVMGVSSSYHNSIEFLGYYGLFNLYLYTMTFVYSPSPNAIKEANAKIASSSFPVLREANEEDIIYQRKNVKKSCTSDNMDENDVRQEEQCSDE